MWKLGKFVEFANGENHYAFVVEIAQIWQKMLNRAKKIFREFPGFLLRAIKRVFSGANLGGRRGIKRLIQFHDRI